MSSIFRSISRPASEKLLRQTRIEAACASGWLELALVEQANGIRLARVKTRHAFMELTMEQCELLSMILENAGRMLGEPRFDLFHTRKEAAPGVFKERETQGNLSAIR